MQRVKARFRTKLAWVHFFNFTELFQSVLFLHGEWSKKGPFLFSLGFPKNQGLYDSSFEKESCGIGMVAHLKGLKSHGIVTDALEVLVRQHHRGGQGFDPETGDGAGVLLQIPHEFLLETLRGQDISLPDTGHYGVGMVFIPISCKKNREWQSIFQASIYAEGALLLGWREVPVNSSVLGDSARSSEPKIFQVFISSSDTNPIDLERRLYLIRKQAERALLQSTLVDREQFYISSLSSKTIVYKGLLLPHQLSDFYLDLQSPLLKSAIAVVHSRFSTNTFPTWSLAHPYRYLCHNGEINTIKGNVNWMNARQGNLTEHFEENLNRIYPIISKNQSDSASLDNALEFLVQNGRSLTHAMMMLMPEPWAADLPMDDDLRGFYDFHSSMMEPWDGPAAVCFTDGTVVGTISDRNGLRPCRYHITTDDKVVLASEAGVLPLDPTGPIQIREKGRLGPGQVFLIDTNQGRIIRNEEAKKIVSRHKPYVDWSRESRISIHEIPNPAISIETESSLTLLQLQKLAGLYKEEIKRILLPMALSGEEPTSSMGNDIPLAVLSSRPQLLFNYFRQMFAQVTNPPIDPIRERLVMSLEVRLGAKHPLLSDEASLCKSIVLSSPVLSKTEMAKVRLYSNSDFKIKTLSAIFEIRSTSSGLARSLSRLCRSAKTAIEAGNKILIISDRDADSNWAPIPSLLAVSTLHQYLIHKSLRTQTSLVVESSEPWSTHHFGCLLGFGAEAIHPYVALDSLENLNPKATAANYIQALNKGLLKIFSKMGISTVQSYCGAQIFEIIGLSSKLVKRHFTGTASRIEGMDLKELANESVLRHEAALSILDSPIQGTIHFRGQGEKHYWNPNSITQLQQATQLNDAKTFKEFSDLANSENYGTTLRGLLELNLSPTPTPLEEVESVQAIVKRFTTGAMSFGALSQEAHETLAIAMNRMGAKSNSGEGGEDQQRFGFLKGGESKNSAIKQIASARFGVTAHYLVNAKELQIKMAQGAKPGEGGQLPGDKVDQTIARLRYSTPGVQLISPPPHHDIYSIEDLAQLIFDLKNVNDQADISVKLVAEAGVGTIAAGVAKAYADKILISGDSGGTGASSLSSIKHAGSPWELGLAETHQTLVLNGLRNRVRIETDGQLKTGRDVVIAAILGAEEFGFSTAPLIVEGCIMMRKCHLNTCPVGIATQDPQLRKKFTGRPEHVINYFFFVAEEVRILLSILGVKTVNELIGKVDLLRLNDARAPKAKKLSVAALLAKPLTGIPYDSTPQKQNHSRLDLSQILDKKLLKLCDLSTLNREKSIFADLPIQNTDRSTGAMLSGIISKKFGSDGLPEDTLQIRFQGSAGQSFGSFLCPGITFRLEGESNDYVGKGLSGGKIIIYPPQRSLFKAEETVLVGNTVLFGATSGSAYFNGQAGERFAVRNSGANTVIEGVGDHACEYMTGGIVVIIGPIGKNFGAGMSGGTAFIYDEKSTFAQKCKQKSIEIDLVRSHNDQALLHRLIENHLKYTRSPQAFRLLKNWDKSLSKFLKVIPLEYKKALIGSQAAYQPKLPSEAGLHV
jgi:glutamate synthase (NADPH/NADH) large chain